MTLASYFLFVGASLILILTPGPDMLYMLGRSMAQGRRAGIVAAFGINAGAYVHLAAAVTGLSAVLLTSAVAFTAIKWIGAAYLIYLGVNALRDRQRLSIAYDTLTGRSLRAIFWQGFLSDALNPKVAIFFLSFLPQFVNVEAGEPVVQLLALGLTVNMLAIAVNVVIVSLTAEITATLRQNPVAARWLQKAMGVIFVGLGLRLAAEKA
ncbi:MULTISPECIES: LysE family translocator [Methylocystis]|uniref:LysE family translocator n=1 Tax=Methylocystis TaxID=133 RepID=UPI0024B9581F|nr:MULTISPECIES: LysE family translocator [Methylocystis]MDJ0450971.1 LysE family translocator [Methylocystis sp. JR02]